MMHFPDIGARYEILAQIGRGGMGRVYKAIDTHIDREVAIKFLNGAFLNDPVITQRFKREVETLANVRHTAIVPLYSYGGLDSPSQDNPPYIVMRLMNQSLSDVLLQGETMSYPTVVHIIERIAQALDFIHQRGLIHRDLKPQNIFLDQQNYGYLGDFGIAHETMGQTIMADGIIGTPHYMSPEQIKAEPLDGRSDIYSLGCILYQLLSGEKPFRQIEAGTAVFQAHHFANRPSIGTEMAKQLGLPERINEILSKAMAVNRDERYGTAKELVVALKRVSKTPLSSINYPPPPFYTDAIIQQHATSVMMQANVPALNPAKQASVSPQRFSTGSIIGAVAIVGIAILSLFSLFGGTETADPPITTKIQPDTLTATQTATPTHTPTATPPNREESGQTILICEEPASDNLFINIIKASEYAVIERKGNIEPTSFGVNIFCQGEEIMIKSNRDILDFRYSGTRFVMGKFAQVAVSDTYVSIIDGDFLIESQQLSEPILLADNIEVLIDAGILGIRVSETDQKLQIDCLAKNCELRKGDQIIINLVEGEGIFSFADELNPNTTVRSAEVDSYIDTINLNLLLNPLSELQPPNTPTPTLTPTTIPEDERPPQGNLIYNCPIDEVNQICRFDFESNQVVQITDSDKDNIGGSSDPTGSQIIFSSNRNGAWRLYQTDYEGIDQTLFGGRKINAFEPELSPDGSEVVFAIEKGAFKHIWVYNFETKLHRQVTDGEQIDQAPSWTADGSKILFVSDRAGENRIYLINPDGSEINEITFIIDDIGPQSDISPDGKWITFSAGVEGGQNIYQGAIADGWIRPVTTTGNNTHPSYSPDGQWIVFSAVRERAKDSELYVIRVDGSDLTKVTENDINDGQPRWGP